MYFRVRVFDIDHVVRFFIFDFEERLLQMRSREADQKPVFAGGASSRFTQLFRVSYMALLCDVRILMMLQRQLMAIYMQIN